MYFAIRARAVAVAEGPAGTATTVACGLNSVAAGRRIAARGSIAGHGPVRASDVAGRRSNGAHRVIGAAHQSGERADGEDAGAEDARTDLHGEVHCNLSTSARERYVVALARQVGARNWCLKNTHFLIALGEAA